MYSAYAPGYRIVVSLVFVTKVLKTLYLSQMELRILVSIPSLHRLLYMPIRLSIGVPIHFQGVYLIQCIECFRDRPDAAHEQD